jgi:hypothetical protein
MSLIRQIEDNVVTDLRLSDTDDAILDNIPQFLNALEKNTTIELIFFDGEFFGCLRGDKRRDLLEVLGKIPSLQEVHMNNSLLMVSDCTDMITKAKRLRVLKLHALTLQGVQDDISACALAVCQHAYLKDFELQDCSPAVDSVSLEKLEMAGKKISALAAGGSPERMLQVGATVA